MARRRAMPLPAVPFAVPFAAPLAVLLAVLLGGTACSAGRPSGHATSSPSPGRASPGPASPGPASPAPHSSTRSAPSSTRATTTGPTTTAPNLAQRTLAAMSEPERVGQLIMVDCPSSGVASATVTAITEHHVGSVILDGTSQASSPHIAAITAALQKQAPTRVSLFIATDQEGGQVQRLQGDGFSRIPSALAQGAIAPVTLRADAMQWGGELRAAGVNVALGPVLDTVPANSGANPPIGDLDREYGHDPATVATHGAAVVQGLQEAGLAATAKHFPGLGRVSSNTDLTSGVRDSVTSRHDPYLAPFAAAVRGGVAFVMMSTAIYPRIDATLPAVFSPTIITGMLRGDLGFRGVIISDDVGAAEQVSGYSVGARAVTFIAAGGDLVLTVDAGQAPAMTAAILARAKRDPIFRAQVDAAALLVLQAKQARGLLR